MTSDLTQALQKAASMFLSEDEGEAMVQVKSVMQDVMKQVAVPASGAATLEQALRRIAALQPWLLRELRHNASSFQAALRQPADQDQYVRIWGKRVPLAAVRAAFLLLVCSTADVNAAIRGTAAAATSSSSDAPQVMYTPMQAMEQTVECAVCLTDTPKNAVACQTHPVCQECTVAAMKACTSAHAFLACVDPACPRSTTLHQLLPLVPPLVLAARLEQFQNQQDTSVRTAAQLYKQIHCDECETAFVVAHEDRSISRPMRCPGPECKTTYHGSCGRPWHGETPCEKDEAEAAILLQKDVKECPQCRTAIEKNNGCNHMTCVACKHEFCWTCSQPRRPGARTCTCA
jgi:hypothetical protein